MAVNSKILKNIIKIVLPAVSVLTACLLFAFPAKALTEAEHDALVERANSEKRNILIVSKGGETGTYPTVGEAVSAAKDKDIILVLPGEYNESIDMASKELILTGWDKKTCILTHDTTNYLTPVINASAGEISNLTVKGFFNPDTVMDYTFFSQELKDSDPYAFARFVPGYAIHVDDDHMYKNKLLISGCDIYNQQNYCIGIGLRDHYSVTIKDCFVYANGGYGCLFVHDPDRIRFGDDMKVIVLDSKFSSGFKTVLKLQSVRPENHVDLIFMNSIFLDSVDDPSEYFFIENDPVVGEGTGFLGSGAFYLSKISMLNNPETLNALSYTASLNTLPTDSQVSMETANQDSAHADDTGTGQANEEH